MTDSAALPVETLSWPQELTVLCIGWVSSMCSIAGSSCLLYLFWKRRNTLDTLARLMGAMAACDVVHSFGLLWQGILLPASTSPRRLAVGNDASCTALGFGFQFGTSVAFYNGMLSFYYLLTLRYGLTSSQIALKYERYMHTLSIGYPLVTASLGVALNAFHECFVGPMCWIADFPQGCDGDPDIPCKSFLLGYLFAGGPIGLLFICIFVNMTRIYWHVRTVLGRGARRSTDSTMQNQRIEEVATQAYLYVIVFCLTFCFMFLTQSMEAGAADKAWNERDMFVWIVLCAVFFPLQGFFNFFIYMRPRYLRVRAWNLEQSRWWAFQEALKHEAEPPSLQVDTVGHMRRGRRRRPLRNGSDENNPLPTMSQVSPAPSQGTSSGKIPSSIAMGSSVSPVSFQEEDER